MPQSTSWTKKLPQTFSGRGAYGQPYATEVQMVTAESFTLSVSGAKTPGFHNPSRPPLKPLGYSLDLDHWHSETGVQLTKSSPSTKPTEYAYRNYQVEGPLVASSNWYSNSDNTAYAKDFLGGNALDVCDAYCRGKILSKVKGTQINVAVATAEAGKTMTMVGNAAMNIAAAIGNLRRGDFVSAAGNLGVTARRRAKSRFTRAWARNKAQAVASGWLGLQYGWGPLLDDVYGGINEINDIGANQGIVLNSTSKAGREVPYRFYRPWTESFGWSVVQTGSTTVGVRYGVTYKRMLGAPQDLPRLGITNPAVVAWELVPYSFVVDWFLPIGKFLENLDATLGVSFLGGYRTHFRRGEYTQVKNYSSKDYPYLGSTSSSLKRVIVSRIVLSDFPAIPLPRFKNPVSFLHMANGLALLTNLLKK